MRTDLLTTNHGTIITIEANSTRGRRWLERNVATDDYPVQCDHRYGIDILQGALAAGLTLQDTATGRTAVRQ